MVLECVLQMQTQAYNQLSLFETKMVEQEDTGIIVCGGIYTDKNPDDVDPLAPYGLCPGGNGLHFLFDGISHIEEITEIACLHRMKLVEGYGLAILKNKKIFQIRHSGRKHQPDYIIFEGHYEDGFEESLRPILKIFHK